MPIVLYDEIYSPPCRAVRMVAEHLGIELVSKLMNLEAGEHLKPEFLEMNPQHCIPTIDDNGFYLWESRAIMAYLVNKYAPDSPLYPKDPKARAIVDRMLNYDLGNLYKALLDVLLPLFENLPPADDEKKENLKKSLAIFENILRKTPYAAGEHVTLADYSIHSYLVQLEAINPQHCVPTIDDGGFYLWESRAIVTYLVNKYAPDSPLYPKDPKSRAVVDRMLNYDLGNLYKAVLDVMIPVFENRPVDPEKEDALKKSLAIFENILQKTPYAAGKHVTVADYSIHSHLVQLESMIDGCSYADFPKVAAWLQRMKVESPKYKEIHEIPLKAVKEYLESLSSK